MDFYIVRLSSNRCSPPDLQFLYDDSGSTKMEPTLPYLECILRHRRSSIFGSAFEISSEYDNLEISTEWSDLTLGANGLLEGKNSFKTLHRSAADALLDLSDNLPLPGSYILYIIWDARGLCPTDKPCAALVGAVKKLCSWHNGHLKIFMEIEPDNRICYMIKFMDRDAEIVNVKEKELISTSICDKTLWHGSMEILSKDKQPFRLGGFTLSKWEDSNQVIKYSVIKSDEEPGPSHEDDFGNIWLDPNITVVTLIDISTIPLYYYTGKRFSLQYRVNKRQLLTRERVDRLCEAVNATPVSAYYCSLRYVISANPFENTLAHSSEKWRETVLQRPGDLSAPEYDLPSKIKSIPLLVRQSEQDLEFSRNTNGEIVQFTAHVLLGPQEIVMKYPFLGDAAIWGTKPQENLPQDADDVKSLNLNDLPPINARGLFRETEVFNCRMSEAVKRWVAENGGATSIPMSELRKLADDSAKSLDPADRLMLFDCSNLPEEYISPHRGLPDFKMIYEKCKQAIEQISGVEGNTETRLSPPAIPQTLGMHLKPGDVLKHFTLSGELKNSEPVIPEKCPDKCKIPSIEILSNFDEASKVSYHGISYNLDEQESEKFDRKCRRLVEQQVKFETCSIGSSEKVPSPPTIIVAKSPVKKPPLDVDEEKSNQLKKVAEKIYKLRISTRKRNADSDVPKPSTSTMVLRSTPKKVKPAARTSSTSSAEERQKRRSYVQDNKKRLQDIAAQALIDNGIPKGSKEFKIYLKTLFDVSMAFLRRLKSSKDLDRIMTETVARNVQSVISFKPG